MSPTKLPYFAENEMLTEDILDFCRSNILSNIVGVTQETDIQYSIRDAEDFDAGVSLSFSPRKYKIHINAGLANDLYSSINRTNKKQKIALCNQCKGVEEFFNWNRLSMFLYTSSVVFVVMHEIGHVVAGHVDYFSKLRHKYGLNFSALNEIRNTSLAEAELKNLPHDAIELALFRLLNDKKCDEGKYIKLKEIEADGFAVDLILKFRHTLVTLFVQDSMLIDNIESGKIDTEDDNGVAKLIFFSILQCILQFERLQELDEGDTSRAFYQARLLYACLSYVLIMCPDCVLYDSQTNTISAVETKKEELKLFILKQLLPVLIWTQRLAEKLGIRISLVPVVKRDSFRGNKFLFNDIVSIVFGQSNVNSLGAKELSNIGLDIASWYSDLRRYRRSEVVI